MPLLTPPQTIARFGLMRFGGFRFGYLGGATATDCPTWTDDSPGRASWVTDLGPVCINEDGGSGGEDPE